MSHQNLDQLAALIKREHNAILARWRAQVKLLPSAKHLDTPTLNDHIPGLLDELSVALSSHSEKTIPEALREGSPPTHGLQRVKDGFDIEEVVAEYNILRGCIHDLADNHEINLQGPPFHIFNRVFDGAIGLAVQTYATQKALEVQQRREEYLSFVAHDLRTPLNAISLAATVLEVTLPERSSEKSSQLLKALRRNVQYLEVLVRKIIEENANLQTEAGIQLQCRAFDLWPLVESLVHDLHPVAGTARAQLINKVQDDLTVYADATLVKRIFQNLIANAIKYTLHGEIIISANIVSPDGTVECQVSDNGAGIPEDILHKVFEKGETDPQNNAGMGLGLAIVKTFTEAHGGKVTVESKKGSGSTFRFTLPARTVNPEE